MTRDGRSLGGEGGKGRHAEIITQFGGGKRPSPADSETKPASGEPSEAIRLPGKGPGSWKAEDFRRKSYSSLEECFAGAVLLLGDL